MRLNLEELNIQESELYSIEVDMKHLEEDQEERTPEELWKEIKATLFELVETTIGYKMRQKPWITDETLEMVREKRDVTTRDKEKYNK